MKFKMPIGTAIYTVQVVDDLTHGNTKAYGLTKLNEKEILLDRKQQKLQGLHTFLHEFLHAGLHEHGINSLALEEEEIVVDALAHALTVALHRSKKFRELVLEAAT